MKMSLKICLHLRDKHSPQRYDFLQLKSRQLARKTETDTCRTWIDWYWIEFEELSKLIVCNHSQEVDTHMDKEQAFHTEKDSNSWPRSGEKKAEWTLAIQKRWQQTAATR